MTGETVIIDLTPANGGILIPDDANEVSTGVTVNESTDSGIRVNFDKLDDLEKEETIVKPEESEGSSASTYLIAIFATIGVLVMVVLTVVALRRGIKSKGEIHQLTTAEAPATKRENKPTNDLENSNGYTSGAAFQTPDQSKH